MTSEANLRPKTHDDYTMGWICALPKEQTAAIAMLDHKHVDLVKPLHDPNTYTLGSISSHNIVIACLPKGNTGPNSAATVATWMVSTFPSIKVGLLVGIGGGVPPKVRLGDVVVSTPIDQFPGVVQWDFGKAKERGGFERTGSLNNPPTPLLTALTRLETEHALNGSKISEYLDQLKEKWPRLASKYLRSDRHEDLLFRSEYQHISENRNYEDSSGLEDSTEEKTCEFCDRNQVIKKKPRDIRVHYGLIASGSQVIKDAALRNKLNKDLDNHVLCIEMEAAGLINNFPCIVIRGICDYVDSHQNNVWQEHAAATAAAFAKELLCYVQISEVERERPAKEILEKVLNTISAVRENTAHTRAKLERIESIEILNWLTSANYGLQQSDYFHRRQPGTGQWLLDSKEFQTWLATGNQTLFCPGIPGAGKTILTSIVVDYLISEFCHGDVGIAYIYCNFHRQDEQNTGDLLASILKQLAETQSSLPESMKGLYKTHQSRRTRPSVDELYNTLQTIIASYSRVFIIIDALDECSTSNNSRLQFLSHLFDIQIESGINIFATSRLVPEVQEKFKGSTMIEVRAHNCDVRSYLDSQISQSDSKILDICREDIKIKITEAVEGMFLLAQLYFEIIKHKRTQKKVKDALKHLPTGHNAYDYIYEEAMERIMSQAPDTAELASLVLSWIVCAKRPLKALELQHALAVEPQQYSIDEENLLPIADMASICAGLVTVEEESGMIRLIHYTTHEYLERTLERWLPDAQSAITTTCATYLLFNDFKAGPCEPCGQSWHYANTCREDCEYRKRLQSFPLYHYAANHWGHHGRARLNIDEEVMNFLNCQSNIGASVQISMSNWTISCSANVFPRDVTGLHLASYFGIREAINAILQYEVFLDPIDSHGATPLLYAAMKGHEDVVRLLLETGRVDPNINDNYRRTPLLYAIMNEHEGVAKLLLATDGVSPNISDNDHSTPLLYAAMNGHADIVKLLLATDKVDPDFMDNDRSTPLSCAAMNGHKDVVKLLLTTGKVDPGSMDKLHKTPLSYAIENRHEDIIKLLLTTGKVNLNPRDNYNKMLILHTVLHMHEDIIKLLLATGKFNVNIKDMHYKSLLYHAIEIKQQGIIKLLLATAEINPDSMDELHRTPLSYAAENGYEDVVKLLLATGKVDPYSRDLSNQMPLLHTVLHMHEDVKLLPATGKFDVNIKDMYHKSPLYHAIEKDQQGIIKLLLAIGEFDHNERYYGRTPLHMAAAKGNEDIVELLLATGKVDPMAKYSTKVFYILVGKPINLIKSIPLSAAIANGYMNVVKLLVTAGIPNANLIDKDGESPLTLAVVHHQVSILKLLLAKDVTSVNLADKHGRTPLSHAAERGRIRSIKLILATGRVDRSKLGDTYNQTPLFYAAQNRHRDIVRLFLTIDIPIGSTCGYEHKVCDSRQPQRSLKRLVMRHIRVNDHCFTQLKNRRRQIMSAMRSRRHVKRLSYIHSKKRMSDGSMKKVRMRISRRLFKLERHYAGEQQGRETAGTLAPRGGLRFVSRLRGSQRQKEARNESDWLQSRPKNLRTGRLLKLTQAEIRYIYLVIKRDHPIGYAALIGAMDGRVSKTTIRQALRQFFKRK